MRRLTLHACLFATVLAGLPFSTRSFSGFARAAEEESISQQKATENLYNVAKTMAASIKQKMASLDPSSPEYAKLKRRLAAVESNIEGLGRNIPGSGAGEKSAGSQSTNSGSAASGYQRSANQGSANQGSYDQSGFSSAKSNFKFREEDLYNIWKMTFAVGDESYGAFYMFQKNDLNQIEAVSTYGGDEKLLNLMPAFEVVERVQNMTNMRGKFPLGERRQISRILRNIAARGFSDRIVAGQYVPDITNNFLFGYLIGATPSSDDEARREWRASYIAGLNPLNVPNEFEMVGPIIASFIRQDAKLAGSNPLFMEALTNAYLCTRAKTGAAEYAKWAPEVEKAYSRYGGKSISCGLALNVPVSNRALPAQKSIWQKLLSR